MVSLFKNVLLVAFQGNASSEKDIHSSINYDKLTTGRTKFSAKYSSKIKLQLNKNCTFNSDIQYKLTKIQNMAHIPEFPINSTILVPDYEYIFNYSQ